MGVRINEYDYGDNCGLCFPAGLTPEFIMASFTEIKPGSIYNPALHDAAPNRIFKLTQSVGDPCFWSIQDGTYWITFHIQAANTSIRILNDTGIFTFFETLGLPTCTWAEANDTINPVGNIYYGGRFQLAWAPPTGVVSLRNAVENMGIDPDDDIWVDWYPKDDDTMIVRAIRGGDGTRILGEHDF